MTTAEAREALLRKVAALLDITEMRNNVYGEQVITLVDAIIAAVRAEAAETLDVGMLQRADSDVSLIHDFLYGRGGTMDEAHAACWRIHEVLRPLIGRLEAER